MKTVLIVEDDDLLRQMLTEVFTSNRCKVLEACNGAEALLLLQSQSVDLILTDIDMPVKSGLEFLKEFRAFNRSTPAVVMSGGVGVSKEELAKLGVALFLPKPFPSLDSILRTLAA